MYSKEEIEKVAKIDIVDYCYQNNIDVKSDSERYYRLEQHDSLIIDRLKNKFYWNSRGVGGNIINFVREVEGASFTEAMKRLVDKDNMYIKTSNVEFVVEPYEYSIEKEVSRFDKAREYLINERKIDTKIVDTLYSQGLIKQDKYNNVLFVWKDHDNGQIMGCSEQGTVQSDKYKRNSWKSIQKNSTTNHGFNVLNGEPKNLKFFESSIDLLSYATLNKGKLSDTHLISMEGLKPQTVINYLIKSTQALGDAPDSLSICVDNDKAGKNFIDKLKYLQYRKNDGSIQGFDIEIPSKPSSEQKWDWNDACKYEAEQLAQIKRREYLQQQGRER